MAKANSLITLRGTYDGITFVKSTAYGDHVRAARGTHKKAKLNAAFRKQNEKLVKANLPAQILRDAIDPYREDFRYGQLWQNLVKMTNGAMGEDGTFDFASLKPFEIHPKYPLGRLLSLETDTVVDTEQSTLEVTLSCQMPPTFNDSLLVDGYRLGVIVIFPDLKKHTAKTEAVHSSIIGLNDKFGPLGIAFPIPHGAKSFLICVRVDGCAKGELYGSWGAIGMRVVEVGRVLFPGHKTKRSGAMGAGPMLTKLNRTVYRWSYSPLYEQITLRSCMCVLLQHHVYSGVVHGGT